MLPNRMGVDAAIPANGEAVLTQAQPTGGVLSAI